MYFVARGGSRGRSLGTKLVKGLMGGGEDGSWDAPDPCGIAGDPNFWEDDEFCGGGGGFVDQGAGFGGGGGEVEPDWFVLGYGDFDYVWHYG
jgi:hypothetical protein